MWHDRLTGGQLRKLPELVETGRYQLSSYSVAFNGHTPAFSGVLVNDGGERCQIGSEVASFIIPPHEQIEADNLLFRAISSIDLNMQGTELISPLMPIAIIDDESHLSSFEEQLEEVVNKGYLHKISNQPRLDLHYEDQVTDIARAKRLAKGALIHLASHSECWQRQTLSGVIPRKVLARFSEDDYGIYENRVYARLLDKIDRHLRKRLNTLKSLQATVEQALVFYKSENIHFRLFTEVCELWGKTFDQSKASNASDRLNQTIDKIQQIHSKIAGLKQSGLYKLVSRHAQVADGLHMTNILSHDPNYRHVAILWDQLNKALGKTQYTHAEQFKHNQYMAAAFSRYAGLVLLHALRPYLHGKDEGEWAGMTLRLKPSGAEWQLIRVAAGDLSADEVLVTVVPWLSTSPLPDPLPIIPLHRIIAWPGGTSQEFDGSAYQGPWIPLSPSDLYCVERFGQLIDQVLSYQVLQNYARPLSKIPAKVLTKADGLAGIYVNHQAHELAVREVISDEAVYQLKHALVSANANQQAAILEQRNLAIRALEVCPICSDKVNLFFQNPSGFRAQCHCGAERYLRLHNGGLIYDQKIAGQVDFPTLGRRAFSMQICTP